MKRKHYIGLGITLIATVGIYVAINRNRKKKLLGQINEILDKGTQTTGTTKDVKNDQAFSPTLYKTTGGAIPKKAKAESIAKKIHDSIGTFYDNETDIVAAIKSVPTKTQLSYIANIFLSKYGQGLGSFITKYVDKEDNLEQIQSIVNAMPLA